MVAEVEHVDTAALEGRERVYRRRYDRFTFEVEGRVQDYRVPGLLTENRQKSMVSRVDIGLHDLNPCSAIDMGGRG